MDNPRVYLVKEYFVALEEYPSEHSLYHWISGCAPSVNEIKQLTALQSFVSYFVNNAYKCGKQLEIKLEFEQQSAYCQRTISQILLFDSEKVLFVHLEKIVDAGTKCFEVYADNNIFLVSVQISVLGALITEILLYFCELLRIELVGIKSELEGEL